MYWPSFSNMNMTLCQIRKIIVYFIYQILFTSKSRENYNCLRVVSIRHFLPISVYLLI